MKIFSHSVGCFFVLSVDSFAVRTLLSAIMSHLLIVAFISFSLGTRLKKKIAMIFVKACPMFFSGSFTVSGLIFRSLILFEFIFVYGVVFSNIIVLCVAVQFSQNH